jgi:squalene synthase HpnC
MVANNPELKKAYKDAIDFTNAHYENFPVISIMVPKQLRKHVAVIYRFARQADDLSDEGNIDTNERIKKLEAYEESLTGCINNNCDSPFWACVKNTIDQCNLSTSNFYNLIKAFKQDVVKKRYKDFDDVLDYCSNSANPVGRLILELNGITNLKAFEFSDRICTALQLTNFYQDIPVDYEKDRVYISEDELKKYEISEKQFENREINDKFRQLMKYQVDRVKLFFEEGRHLLNYLNGKLKFQIAWTILGGEAILAKIEALNYNTLNIRPTLSKYDMITLLLKSWKM